MNNNSVSTAIRRIRWFPTESAATRQYCLSVLLTKDCASGICGNAPYQFTETEKASHRYFTPETCQAYSRLHDISGVVLSLTMQYEIHITIARAFNWDEVHFQIIDVLKEVYFPGYAVEIVVGEGD